MTEKLKNCVETAEIMINYAETIIDLATELQYLLIEQEGVKQDKQSYSLEEVSELRKCGCDKKRSPTAEGEMDSSVQVQKLYLPVFRLSTKNICSNERTKNTQTQREVPIDNQLTTIWQPTDNQTTTSCKLRLCLCTMRTDYKLFIVPVDRWEIKEKWLAKKLRTELHKIGLFCEIRFCCGTPWKKSPITDNSSYKAPKTNYTKQSFVQFVFCCGTPFSVQQRRCIPRNGPVELLLCYGKTVCWFKRELFLPPVVSADS